MMIICSILTLLLPLRALSLPMDKIHSSTATPISRRMKTGRLFSSSATELNQDDDQSLSTATLFEIAKEFDSNLANGEKVGEYSERMWSNRCVTLKNLFLSVWHPL